MSKPIRPSGAHNRQRKKQEVAQGIRSSKVLSSFFRREEKTSKEVDKRPPEGQATGIPEETVLPVVMPQVSRDEARTQALEGNIDQQEQGTKTCWFEDISLWPKSMPGHVRDQIVMERPQALPPPSYAYPKDDKNRHFSNSYVLRVLPNKETVSRPWLQYSILTDRVYCFCCMLFDPVLKSKLGSDGINNWKHIGDYLKMHEGSPEHAKSSGKWVDAERCLTGHVGIDSRMQDQIQAETKRWRAVLERIMSVANNGNFLGLVELLGKFDPIMMGHLHRVTSQEIHSHYCGNVIQNELISLMGSQVKNAILQRVKVAKYFSVILDCTPDISHTEQLSYTVRIVDITGTDISVKEYFIGYRPAQDTSGEGLANLLYSEMSECGLEMDNCRGQGYDNGANMIGVNKGVQARVLEQYPRALFNPCGCHSLNLVVGDASKSSVKSVSLFGVLQRLYNLFAASTKRWSILSDHVKNLSLKKVCETRWECRIESLRAVRYQFVEIHTALLSIEEKFSDPTLSSEAKSLALHLEDFSFICTLVVWYDLLFQVNIVSKSMQSKQIDLPGCNGLLKNCIAFVKGYRSDGFESAVTTAKEIALLLDVDPTFKATKRHRKTKKMFAYETWDETPENEEDLFKVTVFYTLIDAITTSLERRFSQLSVHNTNWGFLYNIKLLPGKEELIQLCKHLEQLLAKGGDSAPEFDVDGFQLAEELRHIQPSLQKSSITPLEVLQHIHRSKTHWLFPNVWVAIRILLTIPITLASGERSFSKLKLIKTYLRSTMAEERLSALAMLSIESVLVENIDYAAAINAFAAAKSRRVPLT